MIEAGMRQALGLPSDSAALTRRGAVSQHPLLIDASSSLHILNSTQPTAVGEAPKAGSVDALLFDGRQIRSTAELTQVYDWFAPRLEALKASGRIILLSPQYASLSSTQKSSPSSSTALWEQGLKETVHQGLVGFTRSLGKEYGRVGTTANVVVLPEAADPLASATVRFLLSPSAAFISGETFDPTLSGFADGPSTSTGPTSAVVTGAAQGIGAAIVDNLASSVSSPFGSVLAIDVNTPSATAEKVRVAQADVCDTEALYAKIAEHVQATGHPLQAVVLNAGITRDKLLRKMAKDDFQRVLDINLNSIVRLVDQLLGQGSGSGKKRLLAEQGRITLLSSINGVAGAAGQTNYALTKSALIGYARSLAPALQQLGVTINCVAPGFIQTSMTQAMPLEKRLMGSLTNALGQAGLPEDIANTVEFLSSQSSLTAQTFRVCGLHMTGR